MSRFENSYLAESVGYNNGHANGMADGVAVGPASIVSSMTYTCNAMQEVLRPIQVQTDFQFEVLP